MEYQISFFDEEPLTWLEENLLHGSGFEGGKIRLYAASLNMNISDFATYCKKEYGFGGWSIDGGFLDHTPKGIRLKSWKNEYEENYDWSYIAKTIKKLISIDRYLTDKEKETIKRIQEKNDGILPSPTPCARYIDI